MVQEPSTWYPSGELIGRRPPSLHPLANTSSSKCPSGWPMPRLRTRDWLQRLSDTCLLLRSCATWTTRLSTLLTLGAMFGFFERSSRPSAQRASRSLQRRPNCSRTALSTWDTRSARKGSAFLLNTPRWSTTGRSPTPSRPCGPSSGGYYCRFITDYINISAPLVQYTKQDQHEGIPNLNKDPAAVGAFCVMKKKLMSAPILAYPQFHGKPFILDTDFSFNPGAIGGVLSQEQGSQERVIAYGARQLQPRERNYALTKGELLAAIFFPQYYKYYLLHRPFILRTDNWALTWIRSLESPTGMILRWFEILASFDFTVKHRKGTLHGNADALSRAPHTALPSPQEEKILVSDEGAVVAAVQALALESNSDFYNPPIHKQASPWLVRSFILEWWCATQILSVIQLYETSFILCLKWFLYKKLQKMIIMYLFILRILNF